MKNTLSLENYGVAEMTTREMKATNGGVWQIVGAIVVAAATVIMTDWANFKAGLTGGMCKQ